TRVPSFFRKSSPHAYHTMPTTYGHSPPDCTSSSIHPRIKVKPGESLLARKLKSTLTVAMRGEARTKQTDCGKAASSRSKKILKIRGHQLAATARREI